MIEPQRWCWLATMVALGCTPQWTPPGGDADLGVQESSARSPWLPVVQPSDPTLTELAAEVIGDATARSQVAVTYASKIIGIRVRVGDTVRAGDVLVDALVPELVRAQATLASTADRIVLQRDRIAQLESLRGEGLVGGRELFELRTRMSELDAERRQAQAVLGGAGIGEHAAGYERGLLRLRAPADGIVTAIAAVVGEMHDPTSGPLVTLARESPARIEVHAMQPLPSGAALRFELPDGRTVELAAAPVATTIDPSDGSLRLWFDPATPVDLPHGVRGRVLVHSVAAGVLQVPERAIAWQDGAMVVFVRTPDGARRAAVEVVGRSGSSALVRGELAVGDEIAADGAAWVQPVGEQAP